MSSRSRGLLFVSSVVSALACIQQISSAYGQGRDDVGTRPVLCQRTAPLYQRPGTLPALPRSLLCRMRTPPGKT